MEKKQLPKHVILKIVTLDVMKLIQPKNVNNILTGQFNIIIISMIKEIIHYVNHGGVVKHVH